MHAVHIRGAVRSKDDTKDPPGESRPASPPGGRGSTPPPAPSAPPAAAASGVERHASRSPPPGVKVHVGEFKFDITRSAPQPQHHQHHFHLLQTGAPKAQTPEGSNTGGWASSGRAASGHGSLGTLPPVPAEHARTNEQLLAMRKQRRESPGEVVRQARVVSVEEEEAAYERFKKTAKSWLLPSSAMLPSLIVPPSSSGERALPPGTAPATSSLSPEAKRGRPAGSVALQAVSPPPRLTVEMTSMRRASPTDRQQQRPRAGRDHSPSTSSSTTGVRPMLNRLHRSGHNLASSSYGGGGGDERLSTSNVSVSFGSLEMSPKSFTASLTPTGSPSTFRRLVSPPPPPPPLEDLAGGASSSSPVVVPKISFDFRVQVGAATTTAAAHGDSKPNGASSDPAPRTPPFPAGTPESAPASPNSTRFMVACASPPSYGSGGREWYANPNYYVAYAGGSGASSNASGTPLPSVRSEVALHPPPMHLPYWALPPLPVGLSETPRLPSSATPSLAETIDTARNEEQALAWQAARGRPSFRSRVVLSTTAERSKVDVAAASLPWNERFQTLLELPCLTPQDAAARSASIAALQDEFRDAVLPVVETIIVERNVDQKTIPMESMGGIAGGDKYVCGNIVIKFASSKRMLDLYGSHDNAMKSVANEWRGLQTLAASDIPLLHYPLGMMVRFLGHCVWACARIPIAETTLRSGSRDGGKTVVAPLDTGAHAIMEAIGSRLNLKRHRVGKEKVDICGPVDMEIHCGLDGRFYVLDTARLLPPDANRALGPAHNAHLYRTLRHELVAEWPEPLSSDAFSPFGKDNKAEHDDEVLSASSSITDARIPALLAAVDKVFRLVTLRDAFDVPRMLHTRGINLRYLAYTLDDYLRQCGAAGCRPNQPFVTFVAAEIVARCFTSIVRQDLLALSPIAAERRDSGAVGTHSRFGSGGAALAPFHTLIVDRFNQLLAGGGGGGAPSPSSDTTPSQELWRRICSRSQDKFATPAPLKKALETLISKKTASLANLSAEWFYRVLFRRASELLGVTWNIENERDHHWFARLGGGGGGSSSSNTSGSSVSSEVLFTLPLLARVLPKVKMCSVTAHIPSHVLISEGRLQQAEQRFQQELRLRSLVLGESPLLMPLLHSVAEFYAMSAWGIGRPRLPDAVAHCERAVRIFQDMRDAVEDAQQQRRLGSHLQQRRIDEAETTAETHLGRTRSSAFVASPSYSTAATGGEGDDGDGSGSEGGANASQGSAVPRTETLLPSVFWEGYVAALANYGRFLREVGRLQESLDVVATALKMYSTHSVDNKVLTASLHSSQSLTWRRLGRLVQSYESAVAAAAVAESMHLSNPNPFACARFAESLSLLGEAAHLLGRRKEALKRTDDGLKLLFPVDISSMCEQVLLAKEGKDETENPSCGESSGTTGGMSDTAAGGAVPEFTSTSAAVVLCAWIATRLDGVTFEAPAGVSVPGAVLLLDAARSYVLNSLGPYSSEGIKMLMVKARLIKLLGNFLGATCFLEEALAEAESLYGPQSHHAAWILISLAECTFLPGIEQRREQLDVDDDDEHRVVPAGSSLTDSGDSGSGSGTTNSRDEKGGQWADDPGKVRGLRASVVVNSGDRFPSSMSKRHHISRSFAQQALDILKRFQEHGTVAYAYAQAILADIVRVNQRKNGGAKWAKECSEALTGVLSAVALLQALELYDAPPYIYALNVACLLRIDADARSSVIPDLFRCLASSDRYMMVADSDYFTQESILYCQGKNHHAPGAKYKVVLSRDGLLRKLSGVLQLVALLLSQDSLLDAALQAKQILQLMRELFAPHLQWNDECAAFIPLLKRIADEFLLRTGGVLGPVTEIGMKLRKVVADECAKKEEYASNEARRRSSEAERRVEEAARSLQERLTSQAKQVGLYFATRAFANGFALLHALLENFRQVHPNGATPESPHAILTHNAIVKHILFARSSMEGREQNCLCHRVTDPALIEGLLRAEDDVVGTLRCAVLIDPATFLGWSADHTRENSNTHNSQATMSAYRFDDELE